MYKVKTIKMTNKEHLESLNQQKSQLFIDFVQEIEALGWVVIITQSYRTMSKQAELHSLNPKNAAPGLSAHEYGFAIDINALKGNMHLKKSTTKQQWVDSGIPAIAKKYDLRWGGNFSNYYDPIHFDCVAAGDTARWFNYLKETYPITYLHIYANKINWKF